MRRTIHAIAAGTAMVCVALFLPRPAGASDGEPGLPVDGDGADGDAPAPLVERHVDFGIPSEDAQTFVWSSDATLTPPPYVIAMTDATFVPSSGSSTAIPLPPAVWTGLASLAGLGALALYHRRRRFR